MVEEFLSKEKLKQFISDNRLDEVIKNLLFQINEFLSNNKNDIDFVPLRKLSDALIINSGKLNGLEHDKIIGILDRETQKITTAEVQQAVLYIIDKLPLQFWSFGQSLTKIGKTSIENENFKSYDLINLWNEAPDLSNFIGREQDLITLTNLLKQNTKLLFLIGFGGVGKSSLAAKLAEINSDLYSKKLWISLKNAPTLSEVVTICIRFITNNPDIELPIEEEIKISLFLNIITKEKCLIIIDNTETILESQKSGLYLKGFENWGSFFTRICLFQHSSAFIITSREKPKEIKKIELQNPKIKTFKVNGLNNEDGYKILEQHELIGTISKQNKLIQKYSGNPLALKIVSNFIIEFFGNSIELFLNEKDIVFNDINELLEEQFIRLTDDEQVILYWLAINREAITIEQLSDDLITTHSQLNSKSQIIDCLNKLSGKHLIEYSFQCNILLQNVIMEFITQKIITNSTIDILEKRINFISQYSLIKAVTKDYIRTTQKRLILTPIIENVKKATHFNINKKNFNSLITDIIEIQRISQDKFNYTIGNLLNICNTIGIDLSDFNFSNLTVLQAFLRDVELHRVNFTGAHIEKSIFAETLSSIFCVSCNHEGDIFAIGDYSGDIHLWKLNDKSKLITLKGHSKPVWSLDFSPDGRLLISGSDDNSVKLWDIENSICRYTMIEHQGIVRSVSFSPNGQIFASGSWDKTIRIWNLAGQCLFTLHKHTGWIRTVKFSNNSLLLASAGVDESGEANIYLWNTKDFTINQLIINAHDKSIFHLSFDSFDKFLASASADQSVKIWNLADLSNITLEDKLKGHDNEVHNVIYTPDNNYLISCSQDKTIKIWEIINNTYKFKQTLKGHTSWVWSLAFSKKENILLSGSADQSLKYWDIINGICISTIQGRTDWILSIEFKPNSSIFAASSQDKVVRIWDFEKKKCIKTLTGHTDQIPSIAISPNGSYLASGGWDGISKVWDLSTYNCLFTLKHNSTPWSVSINHDNKILCTGSNDSTISIWNLLNGVLIKSFNAHDNFQIYGICFHPSENKLLSTGWDGKIKIWDIDNHSEVFSYSERKYEKFSCAVFSQDGRYFAASSRDQNIYVFDYASKKLICKIQGHIDWINSITFTTDNKLISGSSDKTIKIWDIETGICLKTILEHKNKVNCVKSDKRQNLFASGSSDEFINLYSKIEGSIINKLRAERIYEGTIITNVTGLSDSQKMTLISLGAIDINLSN